MFKSKKAQKSFQGLNIDQLNNTGPLLDVLKDVKEKNFNAYALYVKTVARRNIRNVRHTQLISHPLSYMSDEWDGQLPHEYFEQFHYHGTMPVILTPVKNADKEDPLSVHIKMKLDWMQNVHNKGILAEKHMSKIEKLNDVVMRCPKAVINAMKAFENDPDPNFNSSYNWYYAGHGNLHLVTINGTDCLLHSEFNQLFLTQFSNSELRITDNCRVLFDCGEGINILETTVMGNIVALRTMYKIFILMTVVTNENISVETLKEIDSEVVYTSICFDKHHKHILYATKLNNVTSIINMIRMTGRTVRLQRLESLVNNWNCVLPVNENSYCHLTPKSVAVLDKRCNQICCTWNGLTDSLEIPCNKISVGKYHDDCLYLGTNHNLFTLDIRFNDNHKPKVLQKWTHNLEVPPTYMELSNFEMNRTLINLSSQWCEDTCLIVSDSGNIMNDQMCSGVILPYHPPNIVNTLDEAKSKLLCVSVNNSIDHRILTSITGSLLIENGDQYIIMKQNSLGDIMSQTIYPNHFAMFIDNDSPEKLYEWSKNYTCSKDFKISNIIDISSQLKVFKKYPDIAKRLAGEQCNNIFSVSDISKIFKDETMDASLLDAWGITDPENITEEMISNNTEQ